MASEQDRPQREFEWGLRRIVQAALDSIRAADVPATDEDVSFEPNWRAGRPIPESISVTFRPVGAPALSINLSREQIADSWTGLDRPDVRSLVRQCGARYKDLRAAR